MVCGRTTHYLCPEVDQKRKRRIAAIGTTIAVSLFVFFLAIPFMSGFISRFVPATVEETVGAQMIEKLAAESNYCRDEEGLAALDGLVARLAATTDGIYHYKVYVVDEEVLNAFAAPGGHIVLYNEIIQQSESPNEMAGVLAHEMAHVANRHPARGMVEAMGYGVFRLLTPGDGSIGSEIAEKVLTGHYSREDELEADRYGVEMLNAAGVDSTGLNQFFNRLQAMDDDVPGALEFLSTHPSGDTRKNALEGLSETGKPALTDEEWEHLRNVCSETGKPSAVGPGAAP